MGPAFNNKTYVFLCPQHIAFEPERPYLFKYFLDCRYQLVWNETIRVYKNMITSEGWDKKDVIDIPIVQKFTFKVRRKLIYWISIGLTMGGYFTIMSA